MATPHSLEVEDLDGDGEAGSLVLPGVQTAIISRTLAPKLPRDHEVG